MKLKYWILILVVAATGVAGGVAISQEYDEPAAVSKNVGTAASSEFVQVCYSLAKDGKTFTEFDLDQLTTTATPGKCSGSLKQLTIPVMVP